MVPLLLLPDTTATAATHAASCSPAELVRIHVLHPMSSPGFRRICTLTQNTVRYDGHTFSEVGRGGHIKHTSSGGSSRGVLGSSIDAVAAALGVTASHDQVLHHEHSRSEVYHNERYQKLLDSFNRLRMHWQQIGEHLTMFLNSSPRGIHNKCLSFAEYIVITFQK